MNLTPNSERLRIVICGERNSGKSSLLNAVTGQNVAIVSDVPGTTTDHVRKAMELPGLGACLFVDTAGMDDEGCLGHKRVDAAMDALRGADIILAVIDAVSGRIPSIAAADVPVIPVLNKCDVRQGDLEDLCARVKEVFGRSPVRVSATCRTGISQLLFAIAAAVPQDWNSRRLTEGVVEDGDLVVLVMPQDSLAPKGRLILPQQQTLRELLDRGCRAICCTTLHLARTLASLSEKPSAVITDSQDFAAVKPLVPEGVRLTSFSILMAASKGDIDFFRRGVKAVDTLRPTSRVLVAEACTHAPASEDIGRVKIPAMLRRRVGEGLSFEFVSGCDFPDDLRPYDLVIHCGACMFNRRYVLSRVKQASSQGVAMTNYGILIAYLNNLL